jgi:hypothetical protein
LLAEPSPALEVIPAVALARFPVLEVALVPALVVFLRFPALDLVLDLASEEALAMA